MVEEEEVRVCLSNWIISLTSKNTSPTGGGGGFDGGFGGADSGGGGGGVVLGITVGAVVGSFIIFALREVLNQDEENQQTQMHELHAPFHNSATSLIIPQNNNAIEKEKFENEDVVIEVEKLSTTEQNNLEINTVQTECVDDFDNEATLSYLNKLMI